MYQTVPNSSLYFNICKVHHISKKNNSVKCRVIYYYKSNNEICYWLNPEGKPKNYKLIYTGYKNFIPYIKEE